MSLNQKVLLVPNIKKEVSTNDIDQHWYKRTYFRLKIAEYAHIVIINKPITFTSNDGEITVVNKDVKDEAEPM